MSYFHFPKTALRAGIAALALGSALMTGTLATAQDGFDLSAMTPEQKEAFGDAVRDYLMDNPNVIMEAVAVLEQREQEQQAAADDELVATYLDALHNDGFSWVGGNPEGDVTIVEFFDYRCGYCRKAHPEVKALLEADDNIRLIVKEFPILGDASLVSSKFAIATQIVAGDEAYEQIHDALATLEGAPSQGALKRLADTYGLDADAILDTMEGAEVARRIAETRALAQAMQINGTPSFVFGGEMIRGYVPLAAMQQIVDAERQTN